MKKQAFIFILLFCLSVMMFPVLASGNSQPARTDLLLLEDRPQTPLEDTGYESPNGVREAPADDMPVDGDVYQEMPSSTSDALLLRDGLPGRGSIDAPDKYWAANGYPDDVSYAYEAGGEMLEDGSIQSWWEIGVVDADAARKEEILDMLSPACLVTFHDCTYSYAERQAVFDEIQAIGDARIQSCVMGLNTESVFVWTSPADSTELQKELTLKYANLVVVLDEMAYNDATVAPGAGMDAGTGNAATGYLERTPSTSSNSPTIWIGLLGILLLCITGSFFFFHRRLAAAKTTAGNTVSVTPMLSFRAVEQVVRNSQCAPSEHTWTRICTNIKSE